jgi:transcriptional regulator of nitric oxide reductase
MVPSIYRKMDTDKMIDDNYRAKADSEIIVNAADGAVKYVGSPSGAGTSFDRVKMAQGLQSQDKIEIIDNKAGKSRRSDSNTLKNN